MKLTGYRRFLGTPGVPRLFTAMLIGRLPGGMLALAIVLRITGDGGSYRLAGAVTAGFSIGIGTTSPLLSRLIDRRGQTVVLVPCAVALLATTTLLGLLPAHSSPLILIGAGALVGASLPPLAPTSRTMWPAVVDSPAALEAAYAVDATFQELVFIVGPLLVVATRAVAGTAAAIIGAGALGSVGTLIFAASAASRAWRGHVPTETRRNKALHSAGIKVLVVTMFCLIAGFAATEVALIAAARSAGSAGASGPLLAVWSLGSMVAGFIYGSRSWASSIVARVTALLSIAAVLTLAAATQHKLIVIGALVAVSGAGGAPALASIYRTVQHLARAGVVTESYAWLSVGTLFGSAFGAAVAGQLITTHGAGAGFILGAGSIAAAALVVAVGRRSLAIPDTELAALITEPPAPNPTASPKRTEAPPTP